jgi:hypothetical protein
MKSGSPNDSWEREEREEYDGEDGEEKEAYIPRSGPHVETTCHTATQSPQHIWTV